MSLAYSKEEEEEEEEEAMDAVAGEYGFWRIKS